MKVLHTKLNYFQSLKEYNFGIMTEIFLKTKSIAVRIRHKIGGSCEGS